MTTTPTRQQLLDKLSAIVRMNDAAAVYITTASGRLSDAQASLLEAQTAEMQLRALIESLSDDVTPPPPPPTVRKISFGMHYEKRWAPQRDGKIRDHLDRDHARALTGLLGVNTLRYTVDLPWYVKEVGRMSMQRDLAAAAGGGFKKYLFDLRYIPQAAVILPPGGYPEQCRICTHPRHGATCPICEKIVAGSTPMNPAWSEYGFDKSGIKPTHAFMLADPTTGGMEGNSQIWSSGGVFGGPLSIWPGARGPFYLEGLAYLDSPPHIDGDYMHSLGYKLATDLSLSLPNAEIAIEFINEPANPRYFNPSILQEVAWRNGDRAEYDRLLASTVRRAHDEFIIPLMTGMKKAGFGDRFTYVSPAADTDTILGAMLAGGPTPYPYMASGHTYPWGTTAIERLEAMLAVLPVVIDDEGTQIAEFLITEFSVRVGEQGTTTHEEGAMAVVEFAKKVRDEYPQIPLLVIGEDHRYIKRKEDGAFELTAAGIELAKVIA